MHFGKFSVSTQAQMQFIDITSQAEQAVREIGVADGILYLFNPHTTAGLTVNEGYDPDVQHDLLGVFQKVIPTSSSYLYRHAEGNSPSHILATLTGSSLTVILADNKLQLGTWQRIFFCEYDGPRNRHIMWKVMVG